VVGSRAVLSRGPSERGRRVNVLFGLGSGLARNDGNRVFSQRESLLGEAPLLRPPVREHISHRKIALNL
jgi:hypothetical protein